MLRLPLQSASLVFVLTTLGAFAAHVPTGVEAEQLFVGRI